MGRSKRRRESGEGWTLVRACPGCGRPQDACSCAAGEPGTRHGERIVRLRTEKRRGKPVTVLSAEGFGAVELKELLKELKSRCAAGGGQKGSEVELQGDHRQTVRRFLDERGIRVKG